MKESQDSHDIYKNTQDITYKINSAKYKNILYKLQV